MKIVTGNSFIKREAIAAACRQVGIYADIVSVEMPSGVNAQPEGIDEISLGVKNRLSWAQAAVPEGFGIVAENGIVFRDGMWQDIAIVAIIQPGSNRVISATSEAVVFPTAAVEEARRRGFAMNTVGQVLSDLHGCVETDPHAFLTDGKRTRKDILVRALVPLLEDAEKLGLKKGVFRVLLDGNATGERISMDLPIREVAPGLSVALFDILEDPELANDVAFELAERISLDAEVLVMPEGKAVPIIHHMALKLNLPIVVARKAAKPYMLKPIIDVSVKSITTDKVQTLVLDAKQAEKLRGKKAVFIDDVISTGGSLDAMRALLAKVDCEIIEIMAVLTEGDRREDVIALGHVPLFRS